MGFAFSKLTALARGRAAPVAVPDVPALRRADAHPDAPPRPPIFASRDFDGVEIFARPDAKRRPLVVAPEPEQRAVLPMQGPTTPMRADTQQEDRPMPGFARAADMAEPMVAATAVQAEVEQPVLRHDAPSIDDGQRANARPAPLPLPTHGLSVAELTDRLERGLSSRRRTAAAAPVLADMPIAPAVPVRDRVAPDADEALRAALGTLRTMAARRR